MASRKNPQPHTTEPAAAGLPEVVSPPADAETEATAPVDASAEQPDTATPVASEQEVTPAAGADEAVLVAPELTQEPRYRVAARSPRGFNRGGRFWHPDGEELTLSEIGGLGALEVLQAEPMLIVAAVGGE